MNTRRKLPEELRNRLKPCPIDFKRVENFLKRSNKDLSSANVIAKADSEVAYQLLYDSMLHACLGLLVGAGLQPDIRGKHVTVIQYTAHVLGKKFESKIQFYDRMRRKRHQLLYEPGPFTCTEKKWMMLNQLLPNSNK
jgi:uncharacterized protein (UPF0332 family)